MKKFFVFVALIISCVFLNIINVSAQTIYMPTDTLSDFKNGIFSYNSLNINSNTLDEADIDINSNSISREQYENLPHLFTIDVSSHNEINYEADLTAAKPYLVQMHFRNIGKINNKNLDAIVRVTKVHFSNPWTNGANKTNSRTGFMIVAPNGVVFDGTKYPYSANFYVCVDVDIVWSDTQQTVDLSFLSVQTDIDVYNNMPSNMTVEGWKINSGYKGNYYLYDGTYLQYSEEYGWHNPSAIGTNDVDDTFLKTGVLADTINGKFSSIFYEGFCGTVMQVFSQIPDNNTNLIPVKSSEVFDSTDNVKEKVDSIDDKIVYTVEQKYGNLYTNLFTPYTNFSIRDTIDDDLDYVGAVVKLIDGDTIIDITNNSTYGSLVYDSSTKTVEYSFKSTWLSDVNNYKGQIIKMIITTNVVNATDSYNNVAYSNINSIDYSSNEVEDSYVKRTPTYKYISSDSNIPLPSEIDTTNGSYKITDTNEYLIGENAIRNDDVKVGTVHNVYDEDGNVIGVWTLKSWSADELLMSKDGAEFIGVWEYIENSKTENPKTENPKTENPKTENPKTVDNVFIYIMLFVFSISTLGLTIYFISKNKSYIKIYK